MNDEDARTDPLRTVATFWSPPEAHIARLRLESEGIECFLFDENIVATDWGIANAAGGIKLKVRQSELESAARALAPSSAERLPDEPEDPSAGDAACTCPACGSTEVYRDNAWRRPMLALAFAPLVGPLLIAALPWIMTHPRPWHCMSCGNQWDAVRRGFPVQELNPSGRPPG